jgi:hypothetical protein
MLMREAVPERNIVTIIVSVLAIAGAISFVFAGITIFEKSMVTVTSAHTSGVSRG